MATRFGGKNPQPEHGTLVGSKVMQGSSGVIHRSNSLATPCDDKIGSAEPLTRA